MKVQHKIQFWILALGNLLFLYESLKRGDFSTSDFAKATSDRSLEMTDLYQPFLGLYQLFLVA